AVVLARDHGRVRRRRARRARIRREPVVGPRRRPARARAVRVVGLLLGRDRAADAPLLAVPDQRGRAVRDGRAVSRDQRGAARRPGLRIAAAARLGLPRVRDRRPAVPDQPALVHRRPPRRRCPRDAVREHPAVRRRGLRLRDPLRAPALAAGRRRVHDPRRDPARTLLPSPPRIDGMSADDSMPLEGWDHVELWVGNARQTAYYYERAFGFRRHAYSGPETGVRDRASYALRQGEVTLVVTGALSADHEVSRFACRHGDGVRDIALQVPDAAAAYAVAVERGARGVREPEWLEDEY